MIVNDITRRALSVRREERKLKALGYRRHETDWEIHRGGKSGWRITDARISADGMHVWTKIAPEPGGERP